MTHHLSCPECSQHSLTSHELLDGSISVCTGCGYQELVAGVDVELQLDALAEIDAELADSWRASIHEQVSSSLMRAH